MQWAILAILIVVLYSCFSDERTVTYYINHSEERMTKIRTCQENQSQSDRCMNAYNAQRMIIMGRIPPQ
jgi:hypothetical protein